MLILFKNGRYKKSNKKYQIIITDLNKKYNENSKNSFE